MTGPRAEPPSGPSPGAPVTTIDVGGRRVRVTVRVSFDGIEHVGRLWFAEEADVDDGLPDRGTVPGRTREEVLVLARRFTDDELTLRYRRALATRRRFGRLRETTGEMLRRIRYLNHLAVSVRRGTIDADGASHEMEITERQLHDIVKLLRDAAGVEDRKA